MEIEEEFISGFCRTCNGGQTVCCEYTMEGDKRTLTFMDCAHDRCVNYAAGASTLARNKNYYKPQKCGLFYVKFYLFLCCTELYFIFICDIMRYETQL